MSKRQHSSTASESNAADAADTSLIDVHVFETPDSNKLNKQNKKNSKKSKTENGKQHQKSTKQVCFVPVNAHFKPIGWIFKRMEYVVKVYNNSLFQSWQYFKYFKIDIGCYF